MTQPKPRIKFTVDDYMTTPDDKRCQLLDGELIVAPSPTDRHQEISLHISMALQQFVVSNSSQAITATIGGARVPSTRPRRAPRICRLRK